MANILNAHSLEAVWRVSDQPVVSSPSPIGWNEFIKKVFYLKTKIDLHSSDHWSLYTDNPINFLLGLFALLYSSKTIHIMNIPTEREPLLTDLPNSSIHIPQLLDEYEDIEFSMQDLTTLGSLLVFHTSGSTGHPKEVVKQVWQLENELSLLNQSLAPHLQNSPLYSSVSHHHLYGLLFSILLPLVSGMSQFYRRVDSPESLISLQSGYKTLISSPAFIRRLDNLESHDFKEDIQIISSGGFLPASAAERAKKMFGYDVIDIYGSTETGGIGWKLSPKEEQWTLIKDVSLQVEGDRTFLQSPMLNNAKGTSKNTNRKELDDSIEWGRTGKFILHGRNDSIVKIEEKRVALNDVENRMLEHPWVKDCIILYFQDKRQYLGAVIKLNMEYKEQWESRRKIELNSEFRQYLSRYFVPTVLPKKWRYTNESFRNSMGKIVLDDVRRLFNKPQIELQDNPDILKKTIKENQWNYQIRFPNNYRYFDGHFEELKILPAVAQINWILLEFQHEIGKEIHLKEIPRMKFKNPIFPDRIIEVNFSYDVGRNLLKFTMKDLETEKLCSMGKCLLELYEGSSINAF